MPLCPLHFEKAAMRDDKVFRYVVRHGDVLEVADFGGVARLAECIGDAALEQINAIAVYSVPVGSNGLPVEPALTMDGRPTGTFYDWLVKVEAKPPEIKGGRR